MVLSRHRLPLPVSIFGRARTVQPYSYLRRGRGGGGGYMGAVRRRVVVYKLGYEPPEEDIQLDAQVGG